MTQSCQLLGGYFASLIQACLAILCIGTLIIKRQHESPRREWFVWFLDVMKQGLGASFGHFSNIYLSVVISETVVSGDECQWYCLTYVLDSTLGTALNIIFLRIFDYFIINYTHLTSSFTFGEYGNPPQLMIFFPQLFVWLIIVIISKILLLMSVLHLIEPLDDLMNIFFEPIRSSPEFELILVMILIPTILNTLQFWVTDTFIKRQNNHVNDNEHELDEELIQNIEEDEDELSPIGSKKDMINHHKKDSSSATSSTSTSSQRSHQPSYFQQISFYSHRLLISLGIIRFWRRITHNTPSTQIKPTQSNLKPNLSSSQSTSSHTSKRMFRGFTSSQDQNNFHYDENEQSLGISLLPMHNNNNTSTMNNNTMNTSTSITNTTNILIQPSTIHNTLHNNNNNHHLRNNQNKYIQLHQQTNSNNNNNILLDDDEEEDETMTEYL